MWCTSMHALAAAPWPHPSDLVTFTSSTMAMLSELVRERKEGSKLTRLLLVWHRQGHMVDT